MSTTDPLILSLAELPEFDPRGLEDPRAGWVDAVALAAVARHVGGGS